MRPREDRGVALRVRRHGGADGRATVSPKGGHDGFAALLDYRHLAIPDYPGNNLNDSLRNITVNPHVGLILLVPGRNETIRVDGDAWGTTDPDALGRCRRDVGRTATSAIGVRMTSVIFHCPASFQRVTLRASESWREGGDGARRLRPPRRARGRPADWAR